MAEENEKKDSSAVGKINSAVNKGRNLQRAYKIARAGRTTMMAAEGVGFFANPAGAIILGIGLVLLIVIVILFGGVSGVKGGDPGSSPSPSPTESSTPGPTPAPGQSLAIVPYCQGSPAWQYGVCGNLSGRGCSPTAMAMIASSFGISSTPKTVAQIFSNAGVGNYDISRNVNLHSCSSYNGIGTNPYQSVKVAWVRQNFDVGPDIGGNTNFLTQAKKYIDQHYLLYTAIWNWPGVGGHQILIEDVNVSSGIITIRDPNCSRSSGPAASTINVGAYDFGPVFPIRRKGYL